MKLTVEHPGVRSAERRHVLDLLLGDRFGYEVAPVVSDAARDADGRPVTTIITPGGGRLMVADRLLGVSDEEWLTAASLPSDPTARVRIDDAALLAAVGHADLPDLYPVGGPLVTSTEEGTSLRHDLFGTVFFHLTRYEERASTETDRHDRFPASASSAGRGGFIDRPVVDELADLLVALLGRLGGGPPPHRPRPRLNITHDLDRLRATAGRSARTVLGDLRGDLQRRRRPVLFVERLRSWYRTRATGGERDMYCQHRFLMDVADAAATKATFHLMATGDDAHDAHYHLDDPHVQMIIEDIKGRGHHLGIHGGYRSHLDPGRLRTEADRLRAAAGTEVPIIHGRQHYLRWKNPQTWRCAAEAGVRYDSTLGFPEMPGFRCGTSIPYPVWDLDARRRLPVTEVPLVVMDQTVLTYQRRGWRVLERTMEAAARRCFQHGGTFTLLVHNNVLDTPWRRRRYRRAIRSLAFLRDEAGAAADDASGPKVGRGPPIAPSRRVAP